MIFIQFEKDGCISRIVVKWRMSRCRCRMEDGQFKQKWNRGRKHRWWCFSIELERIGGQTIPLQTGRQTMLYLEDYARHFGACLTAWHLSNRGSFSAESELLKGGVTGVLQREGCQFCYKRDSQSFLTVPETRKRVKSTNFTKWIKARLLVTGAVQNTCRIWYTYGKL